jgi:cysteine-rich repeat protein
MLMLDSGSRLGAAIAIFLWMGVVGLLLFGSTAAAQDIRINLNGAALVGTDFPGSWSADPGSGGACGPSFYTNSNPVSGTTDDGLFQGEVWGNPVVCAVGSGTIPAGSYDVSLYFAEIYFGPGCPGGGSGTGARVFDIMLEGQTVLSGLDVFSQAECASSTTATTGGPWVETFTVDILDGTLDVQLPSSVNNAKISAIEIVSSEVPCVLHTDCDDANVCTDEQCVAGFCETTYNTLSCDDGAACTTGDSCSLGVCDGADTCTGGNVCNLGSGVCEAASISFSKSFLAGISSSNPTTLQFGPDDRLYVGQQNGLIRVYTVVRNGGDDYAVTATETIDLVQQTPNHDDDGTERLDITTRQVTGLLVTGTPANPVLYVSSSDPRIGAGGSGNDLDLDTNSGVITRLTWNGSSWDLLDIVRGLSRSEENHSVNGMQIVESSQTLYIVVGGHTNQGAPSNNFALTAEYALSAAILSVDLAAIGETTYDLPTLDDEDRSGADAFDPFGGNDGKNQAMLVPGGPVQVYAPGFRNAYDVLITQAGRMYTVDNGPNGGWGGTPVNEGPVGDCTNAVSEPGSTYGDGLHFVSGPGYYGGHPNPTRANPANTFNSTNPQSPISGGGNAVECDYRQPGVDDGALAVWGSSTNGLAEYTASNFGGAMQGDLLTASFSDQIRRVQLNTAGDSATLIEALFSSVGNNPLDVTTRGDGILFPGTIWVANHGSSNIVIYEPIDFFNCTGVYDVGVDEDGDGYSNADEIDNLTNECSPADTPEDVDGDFLSDLNDPDDDNDGLSDAVDFFAIDADNGTTTQLPLVLSWNNDDPNPGGLLSLGWSGLMSDGATDYAAFYDPENMTAGGAAGVMTVDLAPAGSAASNDQEYGFQAGVSVSPVTGVFTAQTRILGPFAGLTPQDSQSMGLFVGTGGQDDYVKLVLAANGGSGGLQLASEVGGVLSTQPTLSLALPGPDWVDLFLEVDPSLATVTASYESSIGGVPSGRTAVGVPESIPGTWVDGAGALAVGVISTSVGAVPFPVTWDSFQTTAQNPSSTASASLEMTPTGGINASTYGAGSFILENTSSGGELITQVTIDLSSALLPDLVFDPNGTAGDLTAKCFTADSGGTAVGLVVPPDPCADPFQGPHDNGFDAITLAFTDFAAGEVFTFSVDVDPTSIQGATAPGPNDSGSVSGLELVGALVTVDFSQGSSLSNTAFRVPGTDGGAELRAALPLPTAPTLEIIGVPLTPAEVPGANRLARVGGTPGLEAVLLVVEGGLFTTGLPGGGFDLDAFEANSALVVDEYTALIGGSGSVDIPFSLSDTNPDGAIGHVVAALRDGAGLTGPISGAFVLELIPANCGDGIPEPGEQCDDGNVLDGDCCSSACQFEIAGSICDPGGNCAEPSMCDGAGTCSAGAPVICDDGLFCNGDETCDVAQGCLPGTPPPVDDSVLCTLDSCDEGGNQVLNTPDDAACDDLDPCTADSCDEISGCVNDPIFQCAPPVVLPVAPWPGALMLAAVLVAVSRFLRWGAEARQR